MPWVTSFEPVIGTNPKVLILGSMPGVKSLQDQQYYAHPRNAFWPIMGELFSMRWADDYDERIEQIKTLPLILWDVLQSCHREGSLDSDISADKLQVNAIDQLLIEYPGIKLLVFNGATAEKYFISNVAGKLLEIEAYTLLRLPSTSPAHASLNFQQKLEQWSQICQFCN